MSFRRVFIFICDVCGKEYEADEAKIASQGFFYFPDANMETKHRCKDCPKQPNEKQMGTR